MLVRCFSLLNFQTAVKLNLTEYTTKQRNKPAPLHLVDKWSKTIIERQGNKFVKCLVLI